ncbi:MAG: hypothetical protein IJ849_02215 [Selenomonadaceae bacterium]|nr:hypothetical protein [Selenomonadaceae bacterium]
MSKGQYPPLGTTLTLIFIYAFMFGLNFLQPLAIGDDYLYSFVWTGEQGFFTPLPEDARRLSSLADVFSSLWEHYFTHAGRTVIFLPIFFFLWVGKEFFNFFNATLTLLLVLEIAWIAEGGKAKLTVKPTRILFIFFLLWTFTLVFAPAFLWVTGSLNYLWPTVLLLEFLRRYEREFLVPGEGNAPPYMFGLGLMAGWTNENTIWFFIILVGLFIRRRRREGKVPTWMVVGLLGLILGYVLLLAAPGNMVRWAEDSQGSNNYITDFGTRAYKYSITLLLVFFDQFILWYFLLRSWWRLKAQAAPGDFALMQVAKIFAVADLAITLVMYLSPEFPMRSSFPGMVYIFIAVTVIVEVQQRLSLSLLTKNARRLLYAVGTLYMVITAVFSYYAMTMKWQYSVELNTLVAREKGENKIIEVQNMTIPDWLDKASAKHVANMQFKEDPNSWQNVAYARYHGIKGIKSSPHAKEPFVPWGDR